MVMAMVMTTTGVTVVIGDGDCGGDRGGDGAWWVVMPPRKVDNSQSVKNKATIVIAHPEHVEVKVVVVVVVLLVMVAMVVVAR